MSTVRLRAVGKLVTLFVCVCVGFLVVTVSTGDIVELRAVDVDSTNVDVVGKNQHIFCICV